MVLSHLRFLILLITLLPRASLSENLSHPNAAAAGPDLRNRPFVVVWNMPTANCQKRHNVHLDLQDFGIVENQRQRFQGQNMTIFYRNRLGNYPYISHDGREVNGGIPQLGDLASHLSLVEVQLDVLLRPGFSGVGVIDWEEWLPLWENNFGSKMEYRRLSKQLVRQERLDLSEQDVKLLAQQEFEESARMFMEETLRLVVRRRPGGFWGFYGFPSCYNKNKRKRDKTYTGRCHSGTKQKNDRLSWLWAQSTALYPSIYLPQRLAGSTDAALMIRHRLLEALRVALTWRHGNSNNQAIPVLPYARLAFTHTLNFLNETDLEHTIGESVSLGAAGVVLWGEMKFAKSKKQCVLLRDYIHTVLGPFIQTLRAGASRCSLQLCYSHGRCARRRPNSGRSLSSAPVSVSHKDTDSGSSKYFQQHFRCRCYSGWTGTWCQRKMVGRGQDKS
ncbi:hyaluronidase-3 [Poecilia formosa]|uniref:Hyaluronidase n=1 Tax=Poecilia formosa TaxID=48698 RepID=A0A087X5J4_POEFO|nr:PREDICTED: hyaluronidase-3-like [Poecilia formosa]